MFVLRNQVMEQTLFLTLESTECSHIPADGVSAQTLTSHASTVPVVADSTPSPPFPAQHLQTCVFALADILSCSESACLRQLRVMARGPVRATRPHTPSTRGGRGGLRGSHMRPSCETGRHAAVKKTGKLRSLKNQIRGVQRLLKKVAIPPWVHACGPRD